MYGSRYGDACVYVRLLMSLGGDVRGAMGWELEYLLDARLVTGIWVISARRVVAELRCVG
jgi:hypothetical protein